MRQSPLPRVLLIPLGGTIASVPAGDTGGAVPRLGPAELLASVPGAAGLADLSFASPLPRPSPSGDLTPGDVIDLAELIRKRAGETDGFVVTQGTDTLEETSYLLELLLGPGGPPVVLTGAMRNTSLPGADGPANLLAAIRVAVSPQAAGLGPLVVFADEIHLPRFVRKVHSSSVTAFASPNAGPVGHVVEDRVRIPLVPRGYPPALPAGGLAGPLPTVGITKVALGSAPLRPEHVAGMDGLVVEVFGGGHVPSAVVASLAEINRRIPVVMVTRTGGGELYESTYGFAGSERDLLDRGIVSGSAFDAAKARLLLMLLLASGADRPALKERFATALYPD